MQALLKSAYLSLTCEIPPRWYYKIDVTGTHSAFAYSLHCQTQEHDRNVQQQEDFCLSVATYSPKLNLLFGSRSVPM